MMRAIKLIMNVGNIWENYHLVWQKRLFLYIVPLHCEYIRELNDSNLILMGDDSFVPKAPASARFKMGV